MNVVFQDASRDHREQERQRLFRQKFVAETPPWYHGTIHLGLHAARDRRNTVVLLDPHRRGEMGMAAGHPYRAVRQLGGMGGAPLRPASSGQGTGDDLQAALRGASPVLYPS